MKIAEDVVMLSSRPKGVWGQNPTTRSPYQPKPRHIMPRRQEVQDGCAVVFVAVGMVALFVYILI